MSRVLFLLPFLLLAACGGSGPSAGTPLAQTPTVESDPVSLRALNQRRAAHLADTDEDGLPDLVDPYPERVPAMDGIVLTSVYAAAGELRFPGWMHAGLPLILETRVAPADGVLWAVFQLSEGFEVVPAVAESPRRFRVEGLSLPVRSVYLLGASQRSRVQVLGHRGRAEPLVAEGERGVMQGDSLTLQGVHLEAADFRLNGRDLPVLGRSAGQAQVAIPPDAVGGRLEVLVAGSARQSLPLTVWREVTVARGTDLPAGERDLLHVETGAVRAFDAAAPVRILTPSARAGRETLLREGGDGGRLPLNILTWPDQDSYRLDADTLLLPLLLAARPGWEPRMIQDWQALRGDLAALAAAPAAAAVRERLAAALAAGAVPDREALWQELQALPPPTAPAKGPRVGTGREELYELSVQARYNGRSYPRDEISQFNLLARGSTRIGDFATCLGGDRFNLAAGVEYLDSDLCFDNDSVVGVSLRVDIDRLNRGKRKLKSHLDPDQGSIFNKDIVGGNFGGFLFLSSATALVADDNKTSLCDVEACEIEVITGGLGVGIPDPQFRDSDEQYVADTLLLRVMFDNLLMPLLDALVGGALEANKEIGTCLIREALAQVPTLTVIAADVYQKLDRNSSPGDVVTVLSDSFAKYSVTLVSDQVFANIPLQRCVNPTSNVGAMILARMAINFAAEEAEDGLDATLIGKILTVIDIAFKVADIVSAPQKFVFRAEPNLMVRSLTEELEMDAPGATIFLSGRHLASTGNADPGDNYIPALVIRDRFGTEVRATLIEQNIQDQSDLSQVKLQGELGTLFGADSRASLAPGTATVYLEVPGYPGLPGGVLRVVAGQTNLVFAPRIDGLDVDTVTAGQTVEIRGYRLRDALGGRTLAVELEPSRATQMTRVVAAELRRGGGADDDAYFVEFVAPEPDQGVSFQTYTVTLFDRATAATESFVLDQPLRVGTTDETGVAAFYDSGLGCSGDGATGSGGCRFDDRMTLRLIKADGSPVTDTGGGSTASVTLDPAAGDASLLRLQWNNASLSPADQVAGVEIECEDAGNSERDDVCTVGVVVTRPGKPEFMIDENLFQGEIRPYSFPP